MWANLSGTLHGGAAGRGGAATRTSWARRRRRRRTTTVAVCNLPVGHEGCPGQLMDGWRLEELSASLIRPNEASKRWARGARRGSGWGRLTGGASSIVWSGVLGWAIH